MKIKMLMLCLVFSLNAAACLAEETDPGTILNKVVSTYAALDTYSAEGTCTSYIDTGAVKMTMETSFSMRLKKPNLYLISWGQKPGEGQSVSPSGAVWSDGAQPYLYMAIAMTKVYSKMKNDQMALGGATGISGGVANTIPSLFFPLFTGQQVPFARVANFKLEPGEKVEDEDCYVLVGSSAISNREVYWISKKTYMIRKYSRSLEHPPQAQKTPVMTDEQLASAIKAMGQEVTEERKAAMRKMMQSAMDSARTLKGTTSELHTKVGTPKLAEADFVYKLPGDAVLKASLFDAAFTGK